MNQGERERERGKIICDVIEKKLMIQDIRTSKYTSGSRALPPILAAYLKTNVVIKVGMMERGL